MKKTKKINKVLEFFKTPYSIIIYLILFIICVLFYVHIRFDNTNFYVFSGYNNKLTIMNGSIYTDNNIISLTSPSIIFNDKEIKLKNYKIGYYIKNKEGNKAISVKTSSKDKKDIYKLSKILDSQEFSFIEKRKNANYFTKENLKNINNLIFIISGTDIDNKELNIEIPLEITLLNK